MIRDIFEMTAHGSKVTLRIFSGINKYQDVELTFDNVSKYEKYTLSCIVPKDNELLIECTM